MRGGFGAFIGVKIKRLLGGEASVALEAPPFDARSLHRDCLTPAEIDWAREVPAHLHPFLVAIRQKSSLVQITRFRSKILTGDKVFTMSCLPSRPPRPLSALSSASPSLWSISEIAAVHDHLFHHRHHRFGAVRAEWRLRRVAAYCNARGIGLIEFKPEICTRAVIGEHHMKEPV